MSNPAGARSGILVVEDDPDIRDALCDTLESIGYAATPAANGRDALQRLAEITPCLILLDLMMPVMGGSELLTILRSSETLGAIPVVVISAWSDEAKRLGTRIQDFISKPVALRQLTTTITSFCGAPSKG